MKTLKDLYYDGVSSVWIKTYGYTEVSMFKKVWQPYKHARLIKFNIDCNPHGDIKVYNKIFWIDEDFGMQETDTFEFRREEGNRWVSTLDYNVECKAND